MRSIVGSAASIIVKRAAMLLILLVIVHSAIALLPGDGARTVLGRDATDEQIAATRAQLGLDRPVALRFTSWLGRLLSGDPGTTLRGVPISEVVGPRFLNTLVLGALALLLTAAVSTTLGTLWSLRERDLVARSVAAGSTLAIAIPEFVLGTVLCLVLAVQLGWFPAVTMTDGAGRPAAAAMLVLPTVALAIPQIGWNTHVVHAALRDARSSAAARAARRDGLTGTRIVRQVVLPGTLPTVAMSLATSIGPMLGGALVVETVFNYPGIGSILAGAVADRDATLLLALVALSALLVMAMLLLADLVRVWVLRGGPR